MTAGQNLGVKKRAAVLHVKGVDSLRFLNGMLTQDVQKTAEQVPSGGRSFFLTNKGKIIAPLYFVTLSSEEVIVWTEVSAFAALHQGLERYLIADKVTLTPLGEFTAWSLVQSEFKVEALKTRHPLGLEKIFPAQVTGDAYVLPQGRLSPTHVEVLCRNDNFHAQEMNDVDYQSTALQAGHPLWDLDIHAEDFFLEFPFADAVSFDKGCYIGQETVARGTFRGKVNKSFARFQSEQALSEGDILNEAGEKIGHVRATLANQGTGIAKFDISLAGVYSINGQKHVLQIQPLVDEETFRKGR